MDVLANLDALAGDCVDANVQSVRLHPGVLFGDPSAEEHLPDGCVPGSPSSAASASTASESLHSLLDADSEPCLPAASVRNFDETWQGLVRYMEQCCVASSQPSAHYMAELYALHETLRMPFSSASGSSPSESLLPMDHFNQLRQDLLQWRKECVDTETDSGDTSVPAPFPPVRSSCPVLDTVQSWLMSGCCSLPSGEMNLQQALFLVVFALRLQDSFFSACACICLGHHESMLSYTLGENSHFKLVFLFREGHTRCAPDE